MTSFEDIRPPEWNARLAELEAEVKRAARALLAHTGGYGFVFVHPEDTDNLRVIVSLGKADRDMTLLAAKALGAENA